MVKRERGQRTWLKQLVGVGQQFWLYEEGAIDLAITLFSTIEDLRQCLIPESRPFCRNPCKDSGRMVGIRESGFAINAIAIGRARLDLFHAPE
jgi:hypothetical protein